MAEVKTDMCKVIKVLHSKEVNKNNKIDLRIVKWEKASTNSIENRRLYFNESEGEWWNRTTASIGPEEFAILLEKADEIKEIMGMK